ncbi:hypothetical protein MRX96_029364 [Rhipicephalus microplus]
MRPAYAGGSYNDAVRAERKRRPVSPRRPPPSSPLTRTALLAVSKKLRAAELYAGRLFVLSVPPAASTKTHPSARRRVTRREPSVNPLYADDEEHALSGILVPHLRLVPGRDSDEA